MTICASCIQSIPSEWTYCAWCGAQKRKLRSDLTPQELFRLKEYGSIHFESAGATRKR